MAGMHPDTGANYYATILRGATNASAAGWPGQGTSGGVPYPNAWLRLKREGDVFTGFRGTNGVDWAQFAQTTQTFPTSLLVGMAATANDNNALHIIVPANGPAVVAKASSGGGATHTALAEGQYKQATTSAGYAIELKLPWPGGAPSGGSKVRFDLALNSADTNCSGVDDMRDAQLILFLGTPSPTTCPGGVDAYCDDRAWCSTTLQE